MNGIGIINNLDRDPVILSKNNGLSATETPMKI